MENRLKMEEKREGKKKAYDTNEKLHSETTTKDRKDADVENIIKILYFQCFCHSVCFLDAYLVNASFR